MCRLLGLVANKHVDLKFSLHKFKELSDRHPDGWGIGWYENNSTKVFKQGISAKDPESKLPHLSKKVTSKIIIAHVRNKGKNGAPPSDVNSHPFQYKKWLFAHNGSIDRNYLLSFLKDGYKNKLTGQTDSEVYFYLILQRIEDEGNVVEGIKKAIKEVRNRNYSGLNFLSSDGKNLYAFRYSSRSKSYYSLYRLKREPSIYGPIELLSQETKALLYSKSLKGESAVLICSEKLTKDKEEKWEEVGFGNLLIIEPNLNVKEVQIL